MHSTSKLTFRGYVRSRKEAMIIIYAVHQGLLPKITERIKHADDIRNGSIFVYEEKTSKIKRWTDARKWGPSRVAEGFLEYHEVSDRYSKRKLDQFKLDTSSSRKFCDAKGAYIFKDDGLIKKTINDEVDGNVYHLVAYYIEGRRRDIVPIRASYLAYRVIVPSSKLNNQESEEAVTSAAPLKPADPPDPALNAFPFAPASFLSPVPQPYLTPNEFKAGPFNTTPLISNAAISGSTLQWNLGPILPSPAVAVQSFADISLGENRSGGTTVEETKNEESKDEEISRGEECSTLFDEYMLKQKLDEEFD